MCKLKVKYPSTVKYWHVWIEYFFFNPNISADKMIYLTSTWVKKSSGKKMLSKSLVSLGYWESWVPVAKTVRGSTIFIFLSFLGKRTWSCEKNAVLFSLICGCVTIHSEIRELSKTRMKFHDVSFKKGEILFFAFLPTVSNVGMMAWAQAAIWDNKA